MSQTCQCKCKVCGSEFTAKVADRKRGWARCCSKSCAAVRRERKTGAYRSWVGRQVRDDDQEPTFSNAHQFSNEDYFRGKDY